MVDWGGQEREKSRSNSMKKPYIYTGLEAQLYDQLDELAEFQDVEFYLLMAGLAEGATLDLACGTGRIALPLARQGREVWGLDCSLQMLEQLSLKAREEGIAVETRVGDVRRFSLPRRFGSIMAPGFSLQLLEGEDEIVECLSCCHDHLETDGQLICSFYQPLEYLEGAARESPWALRKEVKVAGGELQAWQRYSLDKEKRIMWLENRYRVPESERQSVQETRMRLRWYGWEEVEAMMLRAGFSEIEQYGDFLLEPPTEESECVAFVGRL